MAKKESTIVYDKHVDICAEYLTDEQFGRLMFALVKGNKPDFGDDKLLAMAYAFIALQKELDDKKYEKKCETNRKNGANGGRPKKNPTKPNGFLKNPNDNENEKDNEKEKDDDEEGTHDDVSLLHLGTFGNVHLTEKEHAALKQRYERTPELIDKVSTWLRSARNDVPDHYGLCVKFANNDKWPRKKVIEPVKPIVVEDPPDPDEQERMVADMKLRVNGAFASG